MRAVRRGPESIHEDCIVAWTEAMTSARDFDDLDRTMAIAQRKVEQLTQTAIACRTEIDWRKLS